MKHDMNELNLRNAFAPMPEECRRALLDAACSVPDEQPVKRTSFRTVLIAAIIIIATMAVAYAAVRLGWADYYKDRAGVALPKAAEEILNATSPKSYEVGPMTFTFTQLLADGKIALSAAEVRTTDGTEALYTPWEPYEAVNALCDTVLDHYGLKPGTPWVEAAKQLDLPLYCVRALIEVDEEHSGGEAMEDTLWKEDGAIMLFNMPSTNPAVVKDVLPVTLYMAVMEFDPYTGEEKEKWTIRESSEIPVSGILGEKTYRLESQATLNGMALEGVRAELYPTGVYIYTTLAAPEGTDKDSVYEAVYGIALCDRDANALPGGISLSSGANLDSWPTIVLENMTSLEKLPDSLIVTDGTTEVVVR